MPDLEGDLEKYKDLDSLLYINPMQMSEEEIVENFLSAIAEEEVGRVVFDEYTNITQSFNSLFFFDNVWSERVEYLIEKGRANRPGTIMKSVEFIVCHDTANNTAGAYNHIGYITVLCWNTS